MSCRGLVYSWLACCSATLSSGRWSTKSTVGTARNVTPYLWDLHPVLSQNERRERRPRHRPLCCALPLSTFRPCRPRTSSTPPFFCYGLDLHLCACLDIPFAAWTTDRFADALPGGNDQGDLLADAAQHVPHEETLHQARPVGGDDLGHGEAAQARAERRG